MEKKVIAIRENKYLKKGEEYTAIAEMVQFEHCYMIKELHDTHGFRAGLQLSSNFIDKDTMEREVLGKWPKDPENLVIPTEKIKKKKQHVMAIFVSGDTTGAQDLFCEDWPPTSAEYLQMADLLEERSGRKAVITNFIELRTE